MKILITNLFLDKWTWSESFIYTLAIYLRNKWHDISFYTLFNWELKTKLEKEWFKCYEHKYISNKLIINKNDNFFIKLYKFISLKIYSSFIFNLFLDYKELNDFDIIHFQHKRLVKILYSKVKNIPKIFISHWKIPKEEQVQNYKKYKMDWYLAVSEEVEENMRRKLPQNIKLELIRNPIDIDYYSTDIEINENLKKILVISKEILNNKKYISIINSISNKINANVEYIWFPNKNVKDTRIYIEKADLIIWLWRCAYESMSMWRNVIILDYLWLDWIIDSEEKFNNLKKYNLSWRYYNNTNFSEEELLIEFSKYNKKQWENNRNLIKKYNDINVVWKQIENFYNEIININEKNINNSNNI